MVILRTLLVAPLFSDVMVYSIHALHSFTYDKKLLSLPIESIRILHGITPAVVPPLTAVYSFIALFLISTIILAKIVMLANTIKIEPSLICARIPIRTLGVSDDANTGPCFLCLEALTQALTAASASWTVSMLL